MNQSQFQQAAGISAGLSARWFPHIDAAMKEFGITAVNDQAMFIAQVGHESAGFTSLVESFNYSVDGLKKTFGKRLTPYQCEMLGRVDGKQVAHQPQIANLVYGDRMGITAGVMAGNIVVVACFKSPAARTTPNAVLR